MVIELTFTHNHYTLGVMWVLTCNIYCREETRKVKDIVINYNNCVVIVIVWKLLKIENPTITKNSKIFHLEHAKRSMFLSPEKIEIESRNQDKY